MVPTITFILGDYATNKISDYLDTPDNRVYLNKAIIAVEYCQLKASSALEPLSQETITAIAAQHWSTIAAYSVYPQSSVGKNLFSLFKGNNHVYAIDNIWRSSLVKTLLLETCGVNKADSFSKITHWSQDVYMALALKALLVGNSDNKNIVFIADSLHFSMVYHFLALLSL